MSDVVVSTTDTEVSPAATSGAPATGADKPAATANPAAETSTASGAEQTEQEKIENDDDEDNEADPTDPAKKPLKGFKKRIDKLNKRAAAAEQNAEYWRQQALKGQPPQETKPAPKTEAIESDRPKSDAFGTHEEYEDALHEWREAKKEKKNEAKAKETQAKTEIQTKVETYQKGVKAVQEKFADHDAVINECEVEVPPFLQQLLIESENGPELSYHLAKNEEELERISRLSPVAAARALGKFEATHLTAPAAQSTTESKTTKAPAPVSPVGSRGSANAPKGIYDDDLPYDEFKRLREQKKG